MVLPLTAALLIWRWKVAVDGEIAKLKRQLHKAHYVLDDTQRRIQRQRETLAAKYAMFAGLFKSKGGLNPDKVAKMVYVPSVKPGGGVKRELITNQQGALDYGAAFRGRGVVLPLMGPSAFTSQLMQSTREICDIFLRHASNAAHTVAPHEALHETHEHASTA